MDDSGGYGGSDYDLGNDMVSELDEDGGSNGDGFGGMASGQRGHRRVEADEV